MRHTDGRIVIFAKAPVPGRCKTRLATAIGPRRAAEVYRRLLQRTVATATAANLAPVSLWCDPDTRHPAFAHLRRDHGVTLHRQPPGNLGRRMQGAFRDTLGNASYAVLIGTDCPALTVGHLADALAHLADGRDGVFGPAEDGGYVLVGLRRPRAALFRGISWGGRRVMAQTRQRLQRLEMQIATLPMLWDVDTGSDLRRARRLGLI